MNCLLINNWPGRNYTTIPYDLETSTDAMHDIISAPYMLGVVPGIMDNRNFEQLRLLKCSVAIHGYNHESNVPFYALEEFSNKPVKVIREKIRKSYELLEEFRPTAFVPAFEKFSLGTVQEYRRYGVNYVISNNNHVSGFKYKLTPAACPIDDYSNAHLKYVTNAGDGIILLDFITLVKEDFNYLSEFCNTIRDNLVSWEQMMIYTDANGNLHKSMSRVIDGIYIGNSADVINTELLTQNNIKAVVNVANDLDIFPPNIDSSVCGLIDGPGNNVESMVSAAKKVAELTKKYKAILIYGHEGRSRTPVVAALAICVINKTISVQDFELTLKMVTAIRECEPDPNVIDIARKAVLKC